MSGMIFLGFVPTPEAAVDEYVRQFGGEPEVSGMPGIARIMLHDKVLSLPQAYAVVEVMR